ncbi:putative adenylate/guanylate cyclase transmembrane protein [Candidatus Pelagibacter sp. HTCC7211]|uniref:CHASE2 domain-containing protein n=2 Tax=Pseudomonadota TaxID=1224 RepID=UPI00018393D8|nr:CHASE2 domain-containing protein [Candidatus Pelagibacter sp. HTCC7211]EDZ60156.1 putative adenylate/guanylate cyclase transmembrane protein [Candidatus Pelagibacter sp. HTCC7211]
MINKKYIYLSVIFVFLIIIKFINPPIIQKISFLNYDFYQKVFNRGEVKDVTIVDIDEKSIAKVGQFPWRRDIYSKILKNLNRHNPKAIAFDIVFSEEDKQNPKDLLQQLQKESNQLIDIEVEDTNKIFIESIKNSKAILPILGEPKNNFVKNNSKPKLRLLAKGENPKNFIYKFKHKIISLEEISSAASGIGSISLIPSIDGVIRNVPVLYNIDDKIWPSLALESVRIATGQKNLLVKSSKNGIELIKTRKNTIPSDQNAVINVKFNKFSKENYISAVDVANNDFDQKKVENKIILIGSSAQALFDIVKIANGKYVPGVEIHAHIIDNIFKNESIIKNIYTQLAENIIFLLLLIFLILIPMKIKPKFSIIFFVGSIFVINLSSIIIYQFNFYLDFLFSSVAGTLAFMTSLYFRYLEENSIAIENDKKQSILKKEREIAGEVQKKLFPNNKKIEKYIFAKNTPAKDVSGDYYDYYQVSDNEIYFILGDVTGKGVKAGILMANAAAVFRSLAKMESSVAKTALYMNNQVKDSSYQAMFITVILGKINLEKKEMEFINMGHEPMMVLDPNFNFEYIKSTLPPMGLMPVKDESFFKTTTMDISDKTILIYTDGVTEGYVDEGKELEVAGLESEIKKLNTTSPETIITHATKILTEKGYTLRDDITALGIKIIN